MPSAVILGGVGNAATSLQLVTFTVGISQLAATVRSQLAGRHPVVADVRTRPG
jgi:hypothetical protein